MTFRGDIGQSIPQTPVYSLFQRWIVCGDIVVIKHLKYVFKIEGVRSV